MKASVEDIQRELWIRARERNLIKWETRDGQQIPLKEISDEHLINIIKYYSRLEENENEYADIGPGDGDNMW